MICPKCNANIPDGAKACPACAAVFEETQNVHHFQAPPQQQYNFVPQSPPHPQYNYNQPQQQYNPAQYDAGQGYAIAILVLGILSLFGGGIITGIIALCLSNTYTKIGSGANADKVKAGKICSWISIGLTIGFLFLYTILFLTIIPLMM